MMLAVYEETDAALELRGEYEFRISPARHDILQISIDGKVIPMRVEHIEHRITDAFLVPLPNRLLTTLVIVRRAKTEK